MTNTVKHSSFGMVKTALAGMSLFAVAACASVDNTPGRATIEQAPSERGAVQGIGIEGNDIVNMTDRMVRDMLSSPLLAGQANPPQVIIDSKYFRNESSQRINKNAITDRLRV